MGQLGSGTVGLRKFTAKVARRSIYRAFFPALRPFFAFFTGAISASFCFASRAPSCRTANTAALVASRIRASFLVLGWESF